MKKKLISFAKVCLYVLGAVGSIGFCIYGGSKPCAAGAIYIAAVAFPSFVNDIKTLTD